MSSFKILLISIVIGGTAIFLTLDTFNMFKEHRQALYRLLSSCPLHWFSRPLNSQPGETYSIIAGGSDRLFTKDELAEYSGEKGSPGTFLGILGRVYDVSAGERFYGPGGGYSFFSGKDGTKAFMTGEFNEKGLIDETEGLTNGQMIELEDWIKFYDTSYIYKGKLIGNFYDQDGKPTESLYDTIRRLKEAHENKKQQDEEKRQFPPCNSQFKKSEGIRRLWCTTKSGGVERDWVGVPRQYYTPGSSLKPRCVCVRTEGPPTGVTGDVVHENRGDLDHPNLKLYKDCPWDSPSCSMPHS